VLNIAASQLQGWLGDWIWPFFRIAACLMVAPAFGAGFVPPRLRIVGGKKVAPVESLNWLCAIPA
jgi:flagellar biosynthetic protein FliR